MGQIIHTPYWSIVTLQLPWILSDESGEILFFRLLVFSGSMVQSWEQGEEQWLWLLDSQPAGTALSSNFRNPPPFERDASLTPYKCLLDHMYGFTSAADKSVC